MRKNGILAGPLLAAAALSSVPVRADVLEIGEGGATWIAGGPSVEQQAVESPATPPASPTDVHALAVTVPAATAGPAVWNARVAYLSAKYDISPSLIEALVWQESRWQINAISPVGARGLAQLMPGTARELGVDPNDPLANLEGGARYLRQQLDTFGGDLEKALAAYNAGPGRVKRANGVPAIPETQQYVTAIIGRLTNPVRR